MISRYTRGIPSSQVVRFGVFELDLVAGELRKNGREVRLVGQPMQILRILLERPGEVVTREELRRALWTEDTFVDFDVSLSSAVRKLRDALGDSADNPRFVQTLPRRGYRWIVPVAAATNGEASQPLPVARSGRNAIAAALAIIVLVSLVALGLQATRVEQTPTPQSKPIRSLAVLPFDNLTGDPSADYLADGFTDGLTTELAQIHGLRVISRTSVMRYRHTTKRVADIARDLDVDAIIEGSIMRTDQQLQISAQLIDAATDRHLWAHKYSGSLRDALTLQAGIAQSISAAAGVPVYARKSAGERRAMNPDAYDAYLQGISSAGRQSVEGFRNASTYFEAAIARQPDCAVCYAQLALMQLQLIYGSQPPVKIVPKAEEAARKALQIDPSVALAHRVLGTILHVYYWRWDEGDRELQRSVELDPNSSESHRAVATSLIHRGRIDDALAELDRAHALDPVSFQTLLDSAGALRLAGKYDLAVAQIEKALQIDPRIARAHFQLGITFVSMHRLNDAIREFETADKLAPNPRFKAYLAHTYAAQGRNDEARKILDELESRSRKDYVSSFGLALIHDGLGDHDRAIEAFQRAAEDHAVELSQMHQYPPFRTIASDPRYQALLSRLERPGRPVTASLVR